MITFAGKVKVDGVLYTVQTPAMNGSAITSTTPVAIIAATTGKRMLLLGYALQQPTAAEAGTLTVQDDTGTPVPLFKVGFDGVLNIPPAAFPVPIPVASGKAVNGKSSGSVGDAIFTLFYALED